MLSAVVRFEWRYQTRQPVFFAAAALFLLAGFALSVTRLGPENVPVTSSYQVVQCHALLTLFAVFAAAVFGAGGVLRDTEHGMAEIVFSTPVGRLAYLGGRFAGTYLAAVAAVSCSVVGMLLATLTPWIPPERVGPVDLWAQLASLAVVVLPNVLFVTAALFAVAALTRSAIATYVAAVGLYALWFAAALLTGSPLMAASQPGAGGGFGAALLDPFALASFYFDTRHWSLAEKGARLVPLAGSLLLNRVVWLAAAAGLLAFTYRKFSFRTIGRAKAKSSSQRPAGLPTAVPTEVPGAMQAAVAGSYRGVATAAGPRHWLASFLSATRLELRALFRSPSFLLLLLLWAAVAGSELYATLFDGEYGARVLPTSGMVVDALRQPLALFGTLWIVYFGVEIFWRERTRGVWPILDATPVAASAVVGAKWAAMGLAIATAAGLVAVLGVATQVVVGQTAVQPLVYASLFYLVALPLVLQSAAALAIHAWSPGKHVGMLLVLVFLGLAARPATIGLEHPLWRIGRGPSVGYSDLTGFDATLSTFGAFMLHGSALAVLLLLVAALGWRSLGAPLAERARGLGRQATGAFVAVALAAALAAAGSGAWIAYQTGVRQSYRTSAELADWKADYERSYRHLASVPQPAVTDLRLDVDLEPEAGRLGVGGTYRLVNETAEPVPVVWVAVRTDAVRSDLVLGGHTPSATDARFGMVRFDLPEPLAPGAEVELRFSLRFARDALPLAGRANDVPADGTFLLGTRMLPSLGYRQSYQLFDPRERVARGLPAAGGPSPEEVVHGAEQGDGRRVGVVTTVSTSEGQVALAPGHLERRWREGGRAYFRYRTEVPIVNRVAIASAHYAVARARHGDTGIEVYSHPRHRANVERIVELAKLSLDELERRFGPYPHRELRIAEVAGQPFTGYATPGAVWLDGPAGYLIDSRAIDKGVLGPVDLLARRTAHEVAHQWWGCQMSPAATAGDAFLLESLARYAELRIVERLHGGDHVRRLLEIELDRYLAGRSRGSEPEVPLAEVRRQSYLFSAKGAIVVWAIAELVGEESFDGVLRRLLHEPRPTTHDFLRLLRAVASPEQYALIAQWMERIVLYDFAVEEATTARLPDGRYRVVVRVWAGKVEADGLGTERLLPFDEEIAIALVGDGPDGERRDLRARRLHAGIQEIVLIAARPPHHVEIDPDRTRIEATRADNWKPVRVSVAP